MLASNSLVIFTWCFSEVLLFVSAPCLCCHCLQRAYMFLQYTSHPNLLFFWSSPSVLAKDNSSLCSKVTMIWGALERSFAVEGCRSLLCPKATTFKMSQWLDTVNQLSCCCPSGDAATVLNNSYRFLSLVAGANSRHTVCQKQGYQFHLWSCIESKVTLAVPWLCIKSRVITVILWLCIKK